MSKKTAERSAPTYRIVTLGCKLNQADSVELEGWLRALGMVRITGEGGGGADVVVLNTCTVTGAADREARQIARRLRRANPGATLIATGCYAERDRAALASLPGVDHVVGTRQGPTRVVALAAAAHGLEMDRSLEPGFDPEAVAAAGASAALGAGRTRAYLKVQDGCDLRCSYCIVPAVRGGSRSLPPEDVVRRIERLIRAGYREIVFTGINTGDYGLDLDPPTRLHSLLETALALPGDYRLRLNSLEPKTVTENVIELLSQSDGRLARHLQIPLQSGSDAVLARMRRPYRTAEYARLVERLRAEVPSIGLGADVIVGFPGESDEEFESTCSFIAASPINYLHVFSYSPRPGTPAASYPGRLPAPVVKERSARLRAIGKELSLRFRRSFVGREIPILTLREVRPDGRLRALSDNYIDLGLELGGRSADDLGNRLMTAQITAATERDTLARVA